MSIGETAANGVNHTPSGTESGEENISEVLANVKTSDTREGFVAAKTTKFFEFDQNNSGGRFRIDDKNGIGPRNWIEAEDAAHANARAEALGVYFDGIDSGRDCNCCGDRWYPAHESGGKPEPEVDPRWDFSWHDTVYVHKLDGTIERISKATEQTP